MQLQFVICHLVEPSSTEARVYGHARVDTRIYPKEYFFENNTCAKSETNVLHFWTPRFQPEFTRDHPKNGSNLMMKELAMKRNGFWKDGSVSIEWPKVVDQRHHLMWLPIQSPLQSHSGPASNPKKWHCKRNVYMWPVHPSVYQPPEMLHICW